MKSNNDLLTEIRNALMECWTPIELAYVLEKKEYARAILKNKPMRKLLVSVINRINTLENAKIAEA
jgi:hypothetical protein